MYAADRSQLDLTFARANSGRSELVARHVSYPWSLTQPFYEDDAGTAYVIPQSASGGLFTGERISQRIVVGPRAAMQMRTQGATLVHRKNPHGARSDWRVDVGRSGRADLMQDPLVLGPGAELDQRWHLTLGPEARLLLIDCWTWLESGGLKGFSALRSEFRVRRADADGIAVERSTFTPDVLAAQEAMLGSPIRALATAVVLGAAAGVPGDGTPERLRAALDKVPDCWTGIGQLPHGLGLVVRGISASAARLALWSNAVSQAVRHPEHGAASIPCRRGL